MILSPYPYSCFTRIVPPPGYGCPSHCGPASCERFRTRYAMSHMLKSGTSLEAERDIRIRAPHRGLFSIHRPCHHSSIGNVRRALQRFVNDRFPRDLNAVLLVRRVCDRAQLFKQLLVWRQRARAVLNSSVERPVAHRAHVLVELLALITERESLRPCAKEANDRVPI